MKKYISHILAAVLAVLCLVGCGAPAGTQSTGGSASGASEAEGTPVKIVATIFPEYDWVKEILGENAENADLTLLLDSGVDLHSYQPTADDILKIADCDLFIYVGGGSDTWVEDALQEATNKNMKTIDLCEVLGDTVWHEIKHHRTLKLHNTTSTLYIIYTARGCAQWQALANIQAKTALSPIISALLPVLILWAKKYIAAKSGRLRAA